MKNIKIYDNLRAAIGEEIVTPNVVTLKTHTRVLYVPTSAGDSVIIIKDGDFINYKLDTYAIYYTTTDGNIVTVEADRFDANIVSNTYEDGQGCILFDGPITIINDTAFENVDTLESIIIPDGVTYLGDMAIAECENLKTVIMPNTVTEIGVETFSENKSLTNVTLSNNLLYIGYGAFDRCTSLETISLPISLKSIDLDAFNNCKKLSSVTYNGSTFIYKIDIITELVDNGLEIDKSVFAHTALLTDGMPSSVALYNKIYYTSTDGNIITPEESYNNNELQENTYSNGIGTLVYKNDITYIQNRLFYRSTRLETIVLPEVVKDINYSAFYGTPLKNINLSNVENIYNSAFCDCYNLTNISLDSVKRIYEQAFYGCSGLTSITLPNDIKAIYNNAFYYCYNLTSVTYKGQTYEYKIDLIDALKENGVYIVGDPFLKTGLIVEEETSVTSIVE